MFFKQHSSRNNYLLVGVSIVLFIGFGFSEALISIGSVLVFLHFFFNTDFQRIKAGLAANKSLWMLLAIFAFYLLASIGTDDKSLAIYEINRNLFWVLIPAGIALTPKLKSASYWNLLLIFAIVITLATFTTTVNYFIKSYSLVNFRAASLVRHSSLSIYTVFSAFILVIGYKSGEGFIKKLNIYSVIIWVIWMILFLSVQKSLLGIIALFSGVFMFLLIHIYRIKNRRTKNLLRLTMTIAVLIPILYLSTATYQFYDIKEKTPELELKTELGNPYFFDLNNKTKENGNYVYWYISEGELKEAWNERFKTRIDETTINGAPVYDILIRYMTSMGLKKDASGIAALSTEDYENIMNGVANHIFVDMKYSFYPRIYQTIWELDIYFNSGDPNDKSLSQRIEYMKAAWLIIKENPLGIGVGNWRIEYEKAFDEIDSVLKPELRIEAHNQYLSYTIKFGIIGAVILFALLLFPLFMERKWKNTLMAVFITIVATVSLGDNLLELHSGLSFFTFFYSLILWHSPVDEHEHPGS